MRGRVLLIVVILAIAFPVRISHKSANRGRIYAFETAALKAIQILNTAQVQYNSSFGRFATSLTELGPSGAGLIAASLASGADRGYSFRLESTPAGYSVAAVPVVCGSRRFYSDQSLVIRESRGPTVSRGCGG